MKILFWTLLWSVIAISVLVLMGYENESSAMAQCQKTHSYDTCFQLLNR